MFHCGGEFVNFVSMRNPIERAKTKRLKETPLTEADWINAATDVLVDENVRGIRIDALCDRLGVTKGSFYWHFKGRTQLLSALLTNWRERMTTNVIEHLAALGDNPTERLRALFELPHRAKSPGFARAELSIRDWGRKAEHAQDAVKEVDQLRLDYFKTLLRQHGLSDALVEKRAYIAYAIIMGDSILRVTLEGEVPADSVTDEVMKLLTQDVEPRKP